MRSESELEEMCVIAAKAQGYQHRKLDTGLNAKGWLDHAFWGPGGRHFIVEFKVGSNAPSPKQAARIQDLRGMGHEVHVIYRLNAFLALLPVES